MAGEVITQRQSSDIRRRTSHTAPAAQPSLISSNSVSKPRNGSIISFGSHHSRLLQSRDSIFKSIAYQNASRTSPNEVIKGPILCQMILHYSWYGILLIISYWANWVYLDLWIMPIYFFISFTVLEISRIVVYKNKISLIPLYLSFGPYTIFQLLAGNNFILFGVLWFGSLMAINMQIGSFHIRNHVLFCTALFIAIHALLTWSNWQVQYHAISPYYNRTSVFSLQEINGAKFWQPCSVPSLDHLSGTTNNTTTCGCNISKGFIQSQDNSGCELSYIPIQEYWTLEITCIVSLVLIGIALYMLQTFIGKYAMNLIEREIRASHILRLNDDLVKQLKDLRKDPAMDLDSPITKVIKVVRSLQENCDLDVDTMESLDFVVHILSSNVLYKPNLNNNKDVMDSDVNRWLNDMMATGEDTDNAQELVSNNTGQSDIIFKPMSDNPRIQEILDKYQQWDFNIFDLAEATNGQPLVFLAMAIFEKHNFMAHWNIDPIVMRNFFTAIEAGYDKTIPYHNSLHAADVMHAMYYFIYVLGLSDVLTQEDCFAGLIASVIHDFEHPGVNNAFLINSSSQLALRYNDNGVLENFHCSRAFEVMRSSNTNCNILSSFSQDQFKTMRTSIVATVLATDMAGHFEIIAKFKNKFSSGSGCQFNDPKDRQLLLDVAIKCGDISNAGKITELSAKWSYLIMEEFFRQGDEEKKRGIPISMFMDRTTTVIPKCQVGFIDFIVTPLYETWTNFIDQFNGESESFEAMSNLAKNKEFWKSKQDEPPQVQVIIN